MSYKITNNTGNALKFQLAADKQDEFVEIPAGESTHDDLPFSVLDTIHRSYVTTGSMRIETSEQRGDAPVVTAHE